METLRVKSLFNCATIQQDFHTCRYDPLWRENVIGCSILEMLQGIFLFNVTYILPTMPQRMTQTERREFVTPHMNDSVDLYVRPMHLGPEMLNNGYPLQDIYEWRCGFMLRWSGSLNDSIYHHFYSEPFTRTVWNYLYAMLILITAVFYMLTWWENRLLGVHGECSVFYELLVAIGIYCQHFIPVTPLLTSRKIAYLTFILFAYVIYSFYTSNLLSHLVSDRDNEMFIQDLVKKDYDVVSLHQMEFVAGMKLTSLDKNVREMQYRVYEAPEVDVITGLEAVKNSDVALFSDYITLYPAIREVFENAGMCQLIEVDLFSNIRKYFFSSKHFRYKEQFKIAQLRANEVGAIKRLSFYNLYYAPRCDDWQTQQVETYFYHIFIPLITLASSYMAAILILLLERAYYRRYHKIWPYLE